MSPLTYRELTAELFPRLTGGIRWGLERTQRMLAAVGNPQHSFRVLHVGGTNGKGSVAAHLESVLRHAGCRTGLYSSPHLCTFRERIRIGGSAIGEDALLASAERLWPFIRNEQPSFFEATTAIAFLALAEAGVEYAVIEVGLGGRLDSTNVVTPDVAILTNVSLDHVQLLGHTLEAVATEKAGIIKANVPVVTAEAGTAAARIFADTAARVGAPLHVVDAKQVTAVACSVRGTRFRVTTAAWGELELTTPLPGTHQAMNAALAVRALDVLRDPRLGAGEVIAGVAATRWPGRLQIEEIAGTRWVFDVAHNVAGAEALAAALHELALQRPLVAIVGVLGDKDWQGMLGPLCAAADDVILTMPPTAPAERRWDPDAVLDAVSCPAARAVPDFTRALDEAHRSADGGTVLVTGSFHTVGDALVALRCAPDGADFDVRSPQFRAAAPDRPS